MITGTITRRSRNSRLSSSLREAALALSSLSSQQKPNKMSRVTVFKIDTATLIMHPPILVSSTRSSIHSNRCASTSDESKLVNIQIFTKENFPDWVALSTFFALSQPTNLKQSAKQHHHIFTKPGKVSLAKPSTMFLQSVIDHSLSHPNEHHYWVWLEIRAWQKWIWCENTTRSIELDSNAQQTSNPFSRTMILQICGSVSRIGSESRRSWRGGKIFTRLTDWRTDGWRHLPLLLSWNCGSEVGMKWVRFGQTERMADTELNQMLDHLMPFTPPSFESTTMVISTKTKTYMKECQFCSALDRYTKTADWAMRITESIFVVKFVILHGHTVRPRNDFWVVSHSWCSRRDGIK